MPVGSSCHLPSRQSLIFLAISETVHERPIFTRFTFALSLGDFHEWSGESCVNRVHPRGGLAEPFGQRSDLANSAARYLKCLPKIVDLYLLAYFELVPLLAHLRRPAVAHDSR